MQMSEMCKETSRQLLLVVCDAWLPYILGDKIHSVKLKVFMHKKLLRALKIQRFRFGKAYYKHSMSKKAKTADQQQEENA